MTFPDQTLLTILAGAALLGALAGAAGCFTVLRRQSLAGDVISHATLSGILLFFLIGYYGFGQQMPGWWCLPGGLLTGTLAMGLVQRISREASLGADSGLGVAQAVFFGGGMILLGLVLRLPGGAGRGLESFLFGAAITINIIDIQIIIFLIILLLIIIMIFWQPLRLVLFDAAFARSRGLNLRRYDMLLSGLMVLVILAGVRVAGVVLMVALLTVPAATARLWSRSLRQMMTIAGLIGGLSGLGGAWLSSRAANLPTGPLIVLVSAAIFLVSLAIAPSGLYKKPFDRK